MRTVYGKDISIKELKNVIFGYDDNVDFSNMVESIEANGWIYTTNENGDYYICFPVDWKNAEYSPECGKRDKPISVYEFITQWWGIYDIDLEELTFYFCD